jgi:hypothetical protein
MRPKLDHIAGASCHGGEQYIEIAIAIDITKGEL